MVGVLWCGCRVTGSLECRCGGCWCVVVCQFLDVVLEVLFIVLYVVCGEQDHGAAVFR